MGGGGGDVLGSSATPFSRFFFFFFTQPESCHPVSHFKFIEPAASQLGQPLRRDPPDPVDAALAGLALAGGTGDEVCQDVEVGPLEQREPVAHKVCHCLRALALLHVPAPGHIACRAGTRGEQLSRRAAAPAMGSGKWRKTWPKCSWVLCPCQGGRQGGRQAARGRWGQGMT